MKALIMKLQRFTLSDLVLIVTVLCLIIVLVLPNIKRMRTEAKAQNCQNNLKDIGTAFSRYLSDKDGLFSDLKVDGWIKPLSQYTLVQSSSEPEGMLNCPSQKRFEKESKVDWRGSHYGINQHLTYQVKDAEDNVVKSDYWAVASRNHLLNPADKLLFSDASGGDFFDEGLDTTVSGISKEGDNYIKSISLGLTAQVFLRHQTGLGNFLDLDGHVELISEYPQFSAGIGSQGYELWHPEHYVYREKKKD